MEKEQMNIVITGHVDHGKSTLIGRLLYDTNSIPESIFEEIKKICDEQKKQMQFAYLLDALEEERNQNITIDTTQVFFNTPKRNYIIIDAPGHKELLKNMITGASSADAAILVVDAKEGLQEQTKRHAYILNFLGIKQIIVAINKMDSVNYDFEKFQEIKTNVINFLSELNLNVEYVIPISAMNGENIINKSEKMPWYKGLAILELLDTFSAEINLIKKPLRFPIQDIYNFGGEKIIAGRIESGELFQNQEVILLPQNKKTKIKFVKSWNRLKYKAEFCESIGLILENDENIGRGEIICDCLCNENIPKVTNLIKADIFWLNSKPAQVGDKFILKIATQETFGVIEEIENKFDSSTLKSIIYNLDKLEEAEAGRVVIKTAKPLAIDKFDYIKSLGKFILERDSEIVAGGIIIE